MSSNSKSNSGYVSRSEGGDLSADMEVEKLQMSVLSASMMSLASVLIFLLVARTYRIKAFFCPNDLTSIVLAYIAEELKGSAEEVG